MQHKDIVEKIKNLKWRNFPPSAIIFLSLCSAKEFAKSLRIALIKYPQSQQLHEMAGGELKTNNLKYEDYNTYGDHWEFLAHFCKKYGIGPFYEPHILFRAEEDYSTVVEFLSDIQRAMTIFSREQELSEIFKLILAAHDWDTLGYGFFKYYLERHIEIDSVDGGHADLLKGFKLDDEVLVTFYSARLKMYLALEQL